MDHDTTHPDHGDGVASGPVVKPSQLALPRAACRKVYATVTGSVRSGYVANLTIGV